MNTKTPLPVRLLALAFALALSGCPDPQPPAQDAGPASDVGSDAPPPDAPCDCDDGISCTVDSCDRTGRCVHWGDCPGSRVCTVLRGVATCVRTTACTAPRDCPDLPCNGVGWCWGGYCRYDWTNDRDLDGVIDAECGGTDCQSMMASIPGVEVCNGFDDDCNGEMDDDVPGLDADRMNCGNCWNICAADTTCVAGACTCAEGRLLCITGGWPATVCVDPQNDPEHCGACGTRCYAGTRCIEGVCEYRETLTVTFDAGAYRGPVAFAPNGDFLVITRGRPTRLTYADGRPDVSIPPAPSPFEQHVVRLDRDGGFLGVTSIPDLAISESLRMLAITDDGFYFAGTPSPGEYFGVTYGGTTWPGMVGYVPRADHAVAWVQTAPGIRGVLATRDGEAVVGARDGYYLVPLRLDVHGGRLPIDPRFANLGVEGFAERADGGFAVFLQTGPGNLSTSEPPDRSGTFLLLCDANGLLTEELSLGGNTLYGGFSAVRDDGNGWLWTSGSRVLELTRSGVNWLADSRSSWLNQGMFDGRGVTFIDTDSDGFVSYPVLSRWRDGVEVARVGRRYSEALPIETLGNGHGWRFRNEGFSSTLTRIDLPPLP